MLGTDRPSQEDDLPEGFMLSHRENRQMAEMSEAKPQRKKLVRRRHGAGFLALKHKEP